MNGSAPTVNGKMIEPTQDEMNHKHYLARKLTCSVVGVTFLGVCFILLIQVVMTLTSVDGWEKDVKEAMVRLERENLVKLAGDKADFVGEVFGRHEEGILQLQAFAGEVLLSTPQTMVVEENLEVFSGVLQDDITWEHSVWWVHFECSGHDSLREVFRSVFSSPPNAKLCHVPVPSGIPFYSEICVQYCKVMVGNTC